MESVTKEMPVNEAPSKEEMEKIRKETIKNIKGELEDLRIQAEYEELITTIEVARYKRFEISLKMAQYSQFDNDFEPEKDKE